MPSSVTQKGIAKSNKREHYSASSKGAQVDLINKAAAKKALQERMFPLKQEPFIKRFIRWWKT